ncbi:hypothetical protein PGT21_021721 [Puccinia graminis f. sp. tritici]|uniref:Uncharacterized protein n=1 Tax=Puccinia graminis f. sp. tritici TaxID=56615 RepID=A0A5B0N4A1_PUCGR|nr:hypothetical protein PGT21_021721 [Puccinia graminis f. sp. tritici]
MNYYNTHNNHSQTGLSTNAPAVGDIGNQPANITPHRNRSSVATNTPDGGQLGPHCITPTNVCYHPHRGPQDTASAGGLTTQAFPSSMTGHHGNIQDH